MNVREPDIILERCKFYQRCFLQINDQEHKVVILNSIQIAQKNVEIHTGGF
jgi:hypothetical protein